MGFFNPNYNVDFLKSQKKFSWDSYDDFIRLKNKSFSDYTKFLYAVIYDFFFEDHLDSVCDRIFFCLFLIFIVCFWISFICKFWDPKFEKIEFYEALNKKPIQRIDLIAEAIDCIVNSKLKNLKRPDYSRIKRDFKDSADLLRSLRKKYNPSKVKIQPIQQTEQNEELSDEIYFLSDKPQDSNETVYRKYEIKKSKSQTDSENELSKSKGVLKFPEFLPKRSCTSTKHQQTPFSKITIKKPDFNNSKGSLRPLSESCKKNEEKQRPGRFVLISDCNKCSTFKESPPMTPVTSTMNSDKKIGVRNTSTSPSSKRRNLSCGPVLKSAEYHKTKINSNLEPEKPITSKNQNNSSINKKTPTEKIDSIDAKKEDANIVKEIKYPSNKAKSKSDTKDQNIDSEKLKSLSVSNASEVTKSNIKTISDLKSAKLKEVTQPDNALPKNIKSKKPKEGTCKLESTKKCQETLSKDKRLKENEVGNLKLNKLSPRFSLSKRNKSIFSKSPKSKTAVKECEDKKNKYNELKASVQKTALKKSPTLMNNKKVGFKVKRFMYYKESTDELTPVEQKKATEKESQK